MARAYSGVLGASALCLVIMRGLVGGALLDDILSRGLAAFFLFALVGYGIGYLAEKTVFESVEKGSGADRARWGNRPTSGDPTPGSE